MASITKLSALAPLAVATLLGFAGCNNDPGDGSLTINYRFGIGTSSCSAEGVSSVRVSLGDESETRPCSDEGEITLTGVPARNYNDLLVEGIDAEGVTIRDNLDDPDDDERVEVIGGSSTSIDVTLTPTPAILELTIVQLAAPNTPYAPSEDPVYEDFEVIAAEGSASPLLIHVFEYSQLTSLTNYVPDPERDLDGDRVDTVVVNADDMQVDADPSTPEIDEFSFAPPGDGRTIKINVTCIAEACEGTVDIEAEPGAVTGGGGDTDGDTDSGTGG